MKRPTAGVTRLGWEGGCAVETGFRASQENAKKRGAYPKSGARCVGRLCVAQLILSSLISSCSAGHFELADIATFGYWLKIPLPNGNYRLILQSVVLDETSQY